MFLFYIGMSKIIHISLHGAVTVMFYTAIQQHFKHTLSLKFKYKVVVI
jgi:hypothetical protein